MTSRRNFISSMAGAVVAAASCKYPTASGRALNLARVKADVLAYCESLRDKDGP